MRVKLYVIKRKTKEAARVGENRSDFSKGSISKNILSLALPMTALLALVLDGSCWWVAAAIQAESLLKCPLCWQRIRRGRWIHDVTLPEGRSL